jgi:hypothetical protein
MLFITLYKQLNMEITLLFDGPGYIFNTSRVTKALNTCNVKCEWTKDELPQQLKLTISDNITVKEAIQLGMLIEVCNK